MQRDSQRPVRRTTVWSPQSLKIQGNESDCHFLVMQTVSPMACILKLSSMSKVQEWSQRLWRAPVATPEYNQHLRGESLLFVKHLCELINKNVEFSEQLLCTFSLPHWSFSLIAPICILNQGARLVPCKALMVAELLVTGTRLKMSLQITLVLHLPSIHELGLCNLSWVVQRMQPDPSLGLWVPWVHPAGWEERWCPGEVAQQRGEYCWELFRAQFEDVVFTQSLPNSSTIARSRYASWWSRISAQINFLLGGTNGADWLGLVKWGARQLDRKLV